MKTDLKSLTSIHTGVYANPALEAGDTYFLQLNHLTSQGKFRYHIIPKIASGNMAEHHQLKKDDVLFAAKGTRNFAIHLDENFPKAVASSSFLVLRILPELRNKVLPAFLAVELNHHNYQRFYKVAGFASGIPSISKNTLESMTILIPSLEIQEKIIKLNQLRMQQKDLISLRNQLTEKLFHDQITQAIHQSENHGE